MTHVTITHPRRLSFLRELFGEVNGTSWNVAIDALSGIATAERPVIARMIGRFESGLPFALPHASKVSDVWMVCGGDSQALDQTMLRIERALIPSFAQFPTKGNTSTHEFFDPSRTSVHPIGAELFPNGFYRFVSPVGGRAGVCNRLEQWIELEEAAPLIEEEQIPTYARLSERFHAATAAGQWADAEQALRDLDRYGLTNAENHRFLELVLWARQGRWSDIWSRPDLYHLLELKAPRAARSAMLTACYLVEIAPVEAESGVLAALSAYQAVRPRIAGQLTSLLGLDLPAILTLSAYEAAFVGDRATLVERLETVLEPERSILIQLLDSLPPEPPNIVHVEQVGAEVRLRDALALGDYDAALVISDDIDDPVKRLRALITIAELTGDTLLCRDVVRMVADLPEDNYAELIGLQSVFKQLLRLADIVGVESSTVTTRTTEMNWKVADWVDWMAKASDQPEHPDAGPALDRVAHSFEGCFSNARAGDLAEQVLSLTLNYGLVRYQVYRRAVRMLAADLVADPQFPRRDDGADALYDSTFLAICELDERNSEQCSQLLAFAEALLARDSNRIHHLAPPLLNWFATPTPKFQQSALDAVDLMIEHGVSRESVSGTVRSWVGDLLDRPGQFDPTMLAIWLDIARWSNTGQDLVTGLEKRLSPTDSIDDDPIARLESGLHIVIFTLRPISAGRARDVLCKRNDGLKITICEATTLTTQARELAKSADVPVIVTTCITHALTEGIQPHLTNVPVYPPSSGSSGIVQAILEWAGVAD